MELPQDIQDFLHKNIDSVSELEGLLIFFREPLQCFTAGEMAQRLYIKEAAAEVILTALQKRGLIAPQESNPKAFCYHPSTRELGDSVGKVAVFYAKYLIPVTNYIHSKPRSAVSLFADAFRLRGKS